MRIPSTHITSYVYFVAVDSVDFVTRETGLASFTVQRSRNGAAEVAFTTPTINEIDATTMPGVYALLIDEDTTIASGSDSEEYCLHITHSGMAPITRTIELYRRDTTSGRTALVAATGHVAPDWANIGSPTTAVNLSGTSIDVDQVVASVSGAVGSVTGAVGSVTGAVGSVTGNVGGNVTGSVGSVVGLTASNLDTTVSSRLATVSYTAPPSANANADALLDRASGIETNRTVRQAMRIILASLAGKLSGAAGTTITIRDTNDSVDRVVATVDADGNRTAVTLDAS